MQQITDLDTKLEIEDEIQSPKPSVSSNVAELNQKGEAMKKPSNKRLKRLAIIVAVIILFGIFIILPAMKVYNSAQQAVKDLKVIAQAAKTQDLDGIHNALGPAHTSLNKTKSDLGYFGFLNFIPFLSSYYNDGIHLINAANYGLDATNTMVDIISPYADLLGLKGKGTFAGGGAQERVQKMVQTLDKVVPQLDRISPQLKLVKNEIKAVDPNRYPEGFGKFRIKSQLSTAKNLIIQVETLITDARPALETLPSILGEPTPKTYLILFQNDKELRPSGGFLTAYTYLRVDRGKLSTTGSDDIYHLDERLHQVCLSKICNLTPPAPIVNYLPEPTGKPKTAWDSRDSNIYPDWETSAKEFERFYNIIGGEKIDGIISIDTYVVRDLLSVLGPVNIGGYTTTFTKDNVVNELENYSTYIFRNQAGRKAVLGDLMHSIMLLVLQSGRDKFQPLTDTGLTLLNQKHVMVYMHDPKAQAAAEKFNWAGRIRDYDGDYLAINDANFASSKANMFVTQSVDQKIDVASNGTITKTLTINYTDPGPYSEFNPFYRDWVRVFVPKGSKLISSDGSNNSVAKSEDFNKTVFETFFYINAAGGKRTLTFKYELPFKLQKGQDYRFLIQKQPGTEGNEYSVSINNKAVSKPFKLLEDKELTIKM